VPPLDALAGLQPRAGVALLLGQCESAVSARSGVPFDPATRAGAAVAAAVHGAAAAMRRGGEEPGELEALLRRRLVVAQMVPRRNAGADAGGGGADPGLALPAACALRGAPSSREAAARASRAWLALTIAMIRARGHPVRALVAAVPALRQVLHGGEGDYRWASTFFLLLLELCP
jgi:hypothetical protein